MQNNNSLDDDGCEVKQLPQEMEQLLEAALNNDRLGLCPEVEDPTNLPEDESAGFR